MSDLIERYVHRVGRYLPPKERVDIEAELRSQIQDQLDDRYGGAPAQAEVVEMLTEMGHPYMIAASYSSDKYLVGPVFYPYLMMVLRHGWLIVPPVVIFLHIFAALTAAEPVALVNLLLETAYAALEATLLFSAVVVLIFAILERSDFLHQEVEDKFNPLELEAVNDASAVDRFEGIFGIAFGILVTLAALYYLRVGGLTLRFNLSDPGDVIPFPTAWMILFIIDALAMMLLMVVVMRRNRWNFGLWLTETLLEVFGAVCLYFVVFAPLGERLIVTVPSLSNVPLAELAAILSALSTLIGRGGKMVRLLNDKSAPSFTTQTDR